MKLAIVKFSPLGRPLSSAASLFSVSFSERSERDLNTSTTKTISYTGGVQLARDCFVESIC